MSTIASGFRTLFFATLVAIVAIPAFVRAQGGTNTGNSGGTNTGNSGGTNTGNSGGTNTGDGTILINPLGSIDSLPKLLDAILGAVIQLGAIFLVLMLVFVGFKFVMAQGNEEELRSARTALMWTIIGGLLLLGAQAISLVIQDTIKGLQ